MLTLIITLFSVYQQLQNKYNNRIKCQSPFAKNFINFSGFFLEQIKGENNIVAESLSRSGEITINDYGEIAKEQSAGEGFKNLQKSINLKFKRYSLFLLGENL